MKIFSKKRKNKVGFLQFLASAFAHPEFLFVVASTPALRMNFIFFITRENHKQCPRRLRSRNCCFISCPVYFFILYLRVFHEFVHDDNWKSLSSKLRLAFSTLLCFFFRTRLIASPKYLMLGVLINRKQIFSENKTLMKVIKLQLAFFEFGIFKNSKKYRSHVFKLNNFRLEYMLFSGIWNVENSCYFWLKTTQISNLNANLIDVKLLTQKKLNT